MNESQALARMIPPGQVRPGKWGGGVMQIWVTRACDKACFACTQGSNLTGQTPPITPDQFEQAVLSLDGYFGIVGVFGGNPAVHKQFPRLCDILARHVPFERRGLWCNKLFGNGAVARRTFNPAVSNLNVHLDQAAYDEFKRDWPESRPFGLHQDSRHAPVFASPIDMRRTEAERWVDIAGCDINKHWSAMIGVFRGELRGWFCEIAGAQSIIKQNDPGYPDTGLPIVPGWWKAPMGDFAGQVRQHCHRCAVPLRGYGELAQAKDGTEITTAEYADVFVPKVQGRRVAVVDDATRVQEKCVQRVTDYYGNATR